MPSVSVAWIHERVHSPDINLNDVVVRVLMDTGADLSVVHPDGANKAASFIVKNDGIHFGGFGEIWVFSKNGVYEICSFSVFAYFQDSSQKQLFEYFFNIKEIHKWCI